MAGVKQETTEGENNPCADVVGMEKWISKPEDDEECRPCLLGPVVQWYTETLRENGEGEKAQGLESLAEQESLTPQQLCHKLDSIKKSVTEELRQRLLDFDCSAQKYREKGGD